jgi:protein-tyrosine phosphatase
MQSFNILTVCTGNICRSPLAEQLLRTGLADWPATSISSAGTMAMVGAQMPDQAAALSHEHGGDPSGHQPRALTEQLLLDADLVFALSREHRRAIAELAPRAVKYTFTLREFARLTAEVSIADLSDVAEVPALNVTDRFRALIPLAVRRRADVAPPVSADDDDVVDPYQGSNELYAESARQLVPAVTAIVHLFHRAALIRLS